MAAYGFGSRFHDGRVINTKSRVITFAASEAAPPDPQARVIQGDQATVVVIPKGTQ